MEIIANIAGQGLVQIEIRENRVGPVRRLGPIDTAHPYASPGFIDLQINGFAGIDFSDAELDVERAVSVLPHIWKTGVTSFLPTLITNSIERLERNFEVLETARAADPRFAASVPGYHLEGPYLSPGKSRGAHIPEFMHPPDRDEFSRLQQAAGGNIAIVTLAPELPGAYDFIRRASESGVVVSIGHTDATPGQIHAAIDAGATLSTHLGNGCPEYIHRHENGLWPQLASGLKASLICDGFHIPPDFVRCVHRLKGDDGCILVTDAIHAATLPPGRYSLVGREIELLPNGQVVTADRQSMAGSSVSMNRAIAVFAEFAQVPLEQALRAGTRNPATLLGRDLCSELTEGKIANLVLFEPGSERLNIRAVALQGEVVYRA